VQKPPIFVHGFPEFFNCNDLRQSERFPWSWKNINRQLPVAKLRETKGAAHGIERKGGVVLSGYHLLIPGFH